MKLKVLLLVTAVFFISCSNDKKTTEIPKRQSTVKSDMLLQSTAILPFSGKGKNDFVHLTLSGKTIMNSVATFQALNEQGEEIHCETFPAKDLIQAEYRTANSSLQEAHIREVVEGFFADDLIEKIKNEMVAGL
jgi:hypothetical protein